MHHRDEGPPAFRAPPLACDAHFHVFGPADRYPYASPEPLRYAPPEAPLSEYLDLSQTLGIERFVFVQPSAYGRDNACMLDAMREVGLARCRGIVDVDEDAPDALLAEMDALGVRGVRINYSPVKPRVPGFSREMLPRIRRLEARCRELGWHLDFLGPGWLTEELLPVLASLTVPFSLAHMGMFLAKAGPAQPGFCAMVELLRRDGVRGYAKLTGTYRMATAPGFTDAAPMARALIEAVPDRVIWGSDYPHLSFAHTVGSVQLFNLLADWADERERERILVRNPNVLFGF
jgi:predicted TIM-barrel fold metal-dependent hydrolase